MTSHIPRRTGVRIDFDGTALDCIEVDGRLFAPWWQVEILHARRARLPRWVRRVIHWMEGR